MADGGACVRRLAEVAGLSATAGRSYDWEEIEADIGTRLPSDYKLIAESFPDGWFRMFAYVRFPGSERRLLSDFGQRIMDIVRELPEDEDSGGSRFPVPGLPGPWRAPAVRFPAGSGLDVLGDGCR